jgi:hypothetical protein
MLDFLLLHWLTKEPNMLTTIFFAALILGLVWQVEEGAKGKDDI